MKIYDTINPTDRDDEDVIIDDLQNKLMAGANVKRTGPYSSAEFADLVTRIFESDKAEAAVLQIIEKYPDSILYEIASKEAREMAEEVLEHEKDFKAAMAEDALAGGLGDD